MWLAEGRLDVFGQAGADTNGANACSSNQTREPNRHDRQSSLDQQANWDPPEMLVARTGWESPKSYRYIPATSQGGKADSVQRTTSS